MKAARVLASVLRPSKALVARASAAQTLGGRFPFDYGAGHWQINYLGPEVKAPLRWKDAPADTFMAMGHWGQYLVVIPSLRLVVARLGDERDSSVFDKNFYLKTLVAAVSVP